MNNQYHSAICTLSSKPYLSLLLTTLLVSCSLDAPDIVATLGTPNVAPVANDQAITTNEDIVAVITLSASDAEGAALTYNITQPANGTLTGDAPTVTYTPNANFNGSDSFTFTANDSLADSNVATVSIDIIPVSDLVNFQAADVVIGQTDFANRAINQGGAAGANTINNPFGNPGVYNGILYLPEYSNDRMLGFNTIPTMNNAVADFVLGQPDFTTVIGTTTALGFDGAQTVTFHNNKMFMVDFDNSRVLIWNSIPTSGGVPADIVIGQPDFITKTPNCTATGLNKPEALWVANGKLVVTDDSNNRVLIWNTIPTSNQTAADVVLGQQNFTNCAANDTNNDGVTDGVTAATLFQPAGTWTDGTRLVVLDRKNNRTLIWNSFPTTDFAPADIVLGQNDFTKNTKNDDDQNGVADATATARTLFEPYDGVFSIGDQLYITDSSNNRVLIWQTFPTSNFAPADVVIGQANFTLKTRNDDDGNGVADATASARTLYSPSGILHTGTQLIVADAFNNRYLIFNE